MTAGMTTPTLSTAAAAGDGLPMFGLPWWFPLALLPPLAAVLSCWRESCGAGMRRAQIDDRG